MNLPESKTVIVEHSNKKVYDLGDKIAKVFNSNKPGFRCLQRGPEPRPHLRVRHPRPEGLSRSPRSRVHGWGLLTEKVPGVTLADKMAAEPAKFYEYLEQFVDLQVEIHAERSPLLNRQRDKYARMINGLQHINATTRYNLMERLDGMKKEFQICHGDFNPSNVIVAEDGQLYVCDWAHATQGSPAADASHDLPAVRP
ncbi:MAG: phosphotransferase family protein [Collinsella sp.]